MSAIAWTPAWRFVLCPIKKLALPSIDARTGVAQSRMRYYRVRFLYADGRRPIVYQEVDSNGMPRKFTDDNGDRFLPEDGEHYEVIENGKFQFPGWGGIDWADVFNGNSQSGCWGISEK